MTECLLPCSLMTALLVLKHLPNLSLSLCSALHTFVTSSIFFFDNMSHFTTTGFIDRVLASLRPSLMTALLVLTVGGALMCGGAGAC